jgi:5-methylcytosine-specific restriction protein A
MPSRARRPCNYPSCNELVVSGYCEKHTKQRNKEADSRRGSATERGYNYRWSKSSKQFLKDNPLCVKCEEEGTVEPSRVTDHIVPHKGDYKLFWDKSNWHALCKKCHDRKTATEDGGFGR